VRGWFSPNLPAEGDAHATGGVSVVLRQGSCAQAPSGSDGSDGLGDSLGE
jgi:hypothetical protein